MKNYIMTVLIASALTISAVIIRQMAQAQDATIDRTFPTTAHVVGTRTNHQVSSAVLVTEVPPGYRDWRLISVAHEEGKLNDIRAILGNDIAIKAYREGKLPFPEGTIIARLAWNYVSSEENNRVFGQAQSFVAGHPTNGVQFMIKDSRKYDATGGWGYGHFNDGKPANEAFMQSCFPCHEAIKFRDYIFTRYSP